MVYSAWNFLSTYLLSWALLEKPPIVQLLKNFPVFYGSRRFITVFTRALHWSRSWARSIQSVPSHPISLRSILIFSTHLRLGLPSGLFPSSFTTNILYAFLFPHSWYMPCPSHPPWLHHYVPVISQPKCNGLLWRRGGERIDRPLYDLPPLSRTSTYEYSIQVRLPRSGSRTLILIVYKCVYRSCSFDEGKLEERNVNFAIVCMDWSQSQFLSQFSPP
jgi:hypothetical protein